MASEIVYINDGEIYKEQTYFSGIAFDPDDKFNYVQVSNDDSIATFVKHQDGKVKTYTSTKEARKWYVNEDSGDSLTGYDLCPDITLWWAKGVIDTENYDLYFKIDNVQMLKDVASYYSLPYPITSSIEDKIENDIESISMYINYINEHMALGAVKFISGIPSILKMYCFHKDENNSVIAQKGKSFYNMGQIFEQGTLSHTIPANTPKFESSTSNQIIKYQGKAGDPLFSWEAIITEGDNTKIKHYESSKQYRTIIAHLTTGNSYDEDFDLCPSVNIWIGRSWIENEEDELYFYLENSNMLEAVASYYSLPEPCDSTTKLRIDSNPEAFRLRHYDIYELGGGNWVPVVVASIVFKDNVATMFKLYEITRWNE